MAEFVLGLTKTAVEGTLIRVKSAIEEERSLRMRVQDDLLFITGEFEMLLSFLSVANTERTSNRVVRTWVRQLRELAFDVEDCVEFVVHLDKPSRWDWVRRLTSSLICMARPPLPLDEAVTEIKQLRTRLEDVSQRNTRYSLIGAGNDDSSSGSNPGLVAPATAAEAAATAFHILCEVWEATGKKQHDIGQGDLKKLIDCQGSDLQVLSVWGSTGGGAAPDIGPSITHVIRKAYDDPEICQVFKSRAWVKLVHPFNPDEFLESLLTQFFANSHQEKICVVDDLKKDNLMQQVREQRYLIVLDQVSTVEDWEAIRMYLPDSNKGSRIVMSTQRLGIALLCTGEPYQVSEITRCSHSQPRFSRSQPLRAIYNKGSGHRSGIGEFIRQLRSRGVISVWGAGCDESLLIPNLCQGIMDKSKVFDGLKFQHYLEFTVSDDLDLLMEMAAELCIYSNPQDQQHKMKDKFHEMDRSKIIETWCTFLAAYDELYLIVIMGLKSKDNWDLIKKNLLFEPTKCCVVVLTEDEILSRHCVDYEYRTHMLEDIQDYQQNCGQGGKRREEENWKLVRREDDMNRIGNCLARHGVISVWGIAGVGKSALVRNWYFEKLHNGTYRMYGWVDVHHPLILQDFCRRLLLDFYSDDLQAKETALVGMMEGQDPIQGCCKILSDKKCVVVIDGLQSTHDWDLIKPLFMSQHSESHIILITNEERVATHCTYNTDGMVNVKCLEADAAIELFKTVNDLDLPSGYETSVTKCGGLPRVLIAIGKFMKKSRYRMKDINDDFMGVLEKNQMFHSLKGQFSWMQSYFEGCSDYLKPCIFYLSVFPAGRNIRRRRLLRRWIAEGYCKDTIGSAAEENGEKLFLELVNLSIIHKQAEESKDSCQINGFFREYIVSRPMEDNLVFALAGRCNPNSRRSGKHLTIGEDWYRDEIEFKSLDLSKLRSLTVFGRWKSFLISDVMRLLRVLDLEDTSGVTNDDLEQIGKLLLRLKFLSLRECEEISRLPDSLGGMKQLQTLDIRGTNIVRLPPAITRLEKLQYIRAVTNKVPCVDAVTSTTTTFVVAEATRALAAAGEEDRAAPAAPAEANSVGGCTSPFLRISSVTRPWRKSRARDLVASSSWLMRWPARHHNANDNNGGVELPAGVGTLTALRAIGIVNVSNGAGGNGKAILEELKELTQLRKLKVSGINSANWREFCSVISGHRYLESLSVRLDQQEEVGEFACNFDDISNPPKTLESLKVYGPGQGHARIRPVWIQQLPNLQGVDVELTISTQEDIESLYRACKVATEHRVSRRRICINPTQEHLTFAKPDNGPSSCLDGFSIALDSLRIVCGFKLQHCYQVTFGSLITFKVEMLKVHCSSSSDSSQDVGGSSSSLHLSGLDSIIAFNQVRLTGSYGEQLKQDLLDQLAQHPSKPVLMVEQPTSI
ncbi:uncharacterized protein LOC125524607 isoform X2 [Triticum urartu]|uniref:uncharacterized protein LOC125524607 isoform X2 n=1 Tax=Triticum urartu TaxID=4572 RepID=UPI00204307A1|nr:uncharacterized protein LOC125524607 isoform X2 [Triticum urartu]